MSNVGLQIELEQLYHKNQTLPRLREEFNIPMIQDHCEATEIPIRFAVDLMSHMVLQKRAAISTLVGILHWHFRPIGVPRDALPDPEELQACADMIEKAIQAELILWDEFTQQAVLRVDVGDDVYATLERYQYPPPLVVLPKELTSNRDTGYHSPESATGSLILRNNHHDYDICLDHLNRVNRMALTINHDIANLIQNKWAHIDHQKPNETKKDFQQRVKAFEKYDRTARDILDHIAVTGNQVYLTHKYDKRGRCYSQGYHVNPQGNDWNKAVIEFSEKEPVTRPQIQERKVA